MAIKQYSLKKDGKTYLAPCFQVKEFACRASDTILIDDELVVLLQCIREHFGAKVHITSGYRTAAYNATLPGASKNSQHIQGRAADFWVEGVSVATVAAYAEKLLPGRGGIGRYPKDAAHPCAAQIVFCLVGSNARQPLFFKPGRAAVNGPPCRQKGLLGQVLRIAHIRHQLVADRIHERLVFLHHRAEFQGRQRSTHLLLVSSRSDEVQPLRCPSAHSYETAVQNPAKNFIFMIQ